ncbi:hypothetical protein [Sphingobacterium multivorum]|uniref:hypothetical protein n=1 Tax=Sphingobacterium multivorum TaxID=28454 RepID=UPI0031BAB195
MENGNNTGIYKFLDYDKFIDAFLNVYILFINNHIQPKDVKVLYSEISLERIKSMSKRQWHKFMSHPLNGVHNGEQLFVLGIKLPLEPTSPYNDKIIFYTDNSCYEGGIITEINLKDLEM